MTIRCPKCGEPWTFDSLHTEVDRRKNGGLESATFDEVRKDFYRRGCAALDECPCNEDKTTEIASMAGALYEMLGDTIDGAAAMLEDYEMGF